MNRSVDVEIISPDALTEADILNWRSMIGANPELTSPYFRPEFTQVAGAISPDARIAVFRRDGEAVGYFPHQVRGGTIQPLAAPMNDYHGVISRPGEAPSLQVVAQSLNAPCLRVGAWIGEAEDATERVTLMVSLPGGSYAAWYEERRKTWAKYFKDKERARRSLEAEIGPIEVRHGLRDPALLDQLIALKRDQYQRTGRHDIFACSWTVELLRALLEAKGPGGFGASMAALWAGGKLIAIEYALHADGHYHFWFPVYEPRLARCSPGILLSLETMQLASQDGFRVFDFGFAGEGYKKYFCNASQTLREAVIVRPGLAATASNVAVGLLNSAGKQRGDRLRSSIRHRWGAIEACEVTRSDRLRGVISAAQVAFLKGRERAVSRLVQPASVR